MRLKFNWGTGIFIIILLFFGTLALRIYLAYQRGVDLVEKDYYPKELIHQQVIDMKRNSMNLSSPPGISVNDSFLTIIFPDDFRSVRLSGELTIYRPSESALDQKFSIAKDTALTRKIPVRTMKKGKYLMQLMWTDSLKSYFHEQELIVK